MHLLNVGAGCARPPIWSTFAFMISGINTHRCLSIADGHSMKCSRSWVTRQARWRSGTHTCPRPLCKAHQAVRRTSSTTRWKSRHEILPGVGAFFFPLSAPDCPALDQSRLTGTPGPAAHPAP